MKRFIIIMGIMMTGVSFAQQLQSSSFYYNNALYYNPAYAGSRNTISTSIVHRSQWVGFEGAPTSDYLSIHSPLSKQRLGIGTHLNIDKTGSRSKNTWYADICGSIKLNKKTSRINIGLSFGIDQYNLNFQALDKINANDLLAESNLSTTQLNTGIGIYYHSNNHYIGLSCPGVIETKVINSSGIYNLYKRHYIMTAGLVYHINSVIDIKPSTIIKYVSGAPVSADINISALFYKKLWLGTMGRLGEGLGLNVSYIIKGLSLGYAYEYPLNSLRTNQSGTHEIYLTYDLSQFRKNGIIYSPRYF